MKLSLLLTVLFFILFLQNRALAQTWQWAKMAGTRFSLDQAANPATDECMFMATDPDGNVYAVLTGGRRIFTGTDSSREDARRYVLASWSCSGKFRWMKTLGYTGAIYGFGADTLGGIYMSGYISTIVGNNIDIDTTIPAAPSGVIKGNFILKYDTSGQLKWLRMPDPNTISLLNENNRPRLMRLNVSPNGELDILSYLSAGVHADGGYPVTTDGMYILRYSGTGSFIQGVKLPVTTWYAGGIPVLFGVEFGGGFLRDPVNGRYYIANNVSAPSSYPALFVGNDTIKTNSIANVFMLCFDRNGNLKWKKTQTDSDVATCNDFKLGADGALFLSGQIRNGSTWNGASFTIPGTIYSMGFMVKMDSLGNNLWSTSYYSPLNETIVGAALSIGKNNTLYASGTYGKEFKWGSYSVASGQNGQTTYGRVYLARINPATGAPITMDTLSTGTQPVSIGPAMIAQDRNNNVFAGLMVVNPQELSTSVMTVNSNPLYPVGGNTDIAITKFGNASCTPSTTGIDEVKRIATLSVYPNPVVEMIYVKGMKGGQQYVLYNAIGTKVLSGTALDAGITTISSNLLPAGIYYLRCMDSGNSDQQGFKIIKK